MLAIIIIMYYYYYNSLCTHTFTHTTQLPHTHNPTPSKASSGRYMLCFEHHAFFSHWSLTTVYPEVDEGNGAREFRAMSFEEEMKK